MKAVFPLALILFLPPLAHAALSDSDAPGLALDARFSIAAAPNPIAPATHAEPAQLASASALAVAPVAATAGAPPVPTISQVPGEARDVRTWSVLREQRSLRNSLNLWATAAGWSLVWDLPMDLVLEANATFTGTFEEAVGAAVSSAGVAAYPMQAIFYRGNKVLRIAHANLRK